jgi:Domain of unknown function (DUF3854)/Family of unknown function (DUF5906)
MLDDLARSGLTAVDARLMHLTPFAKGELPEVLPLGAGYRIPYFNIEGRVNEAMFRYRYLEDTRARGFGQLGSAKTRRYTQPAGSPPEVYWPPFQAWTTTVEDAQTPLVLTEGEKKAALCTRMGMPCIGLGGVWSFRSNARGLRLLPELERVNWQGRKVYIAYDSDAVGNTQVCMAEVALAVELLSRGAVVRIVRLPPLPDGSKCGLDDYLQQHGAETFAKMCEETVEYSLSKELHNLNTEVIYIQNPGVVMIRAEQHPFRPHDFVAHRYADRLFSVTVQNGKGSQTVARSAAAEWLKWPARAVARSIVFEPSQDTLTEDGHFNTWKGWPYAPKKGSVQPWTELLNFLCYDSEVARTYIEQWFAYPLQNPGVKMRNAVVLWGFGKGTGKSLLGYTVGDLYGEAFTEIDDDHVEGVNSFNAWARNRHLVMGDDISGNEARKVASRIKKLITREKLEINIKNIPQYTVRDCINYYFTGQHPDCFYLEEGDRRLFIHEVKSRTGLEAAFYNHYDNWRRSTAGRQAMMHHLLYAVDTTGYDPMAAPPMTADKRSMIADTGTELESWVRDMRDSPNYLCNKFGNSDLITLNEFVMMFESEGHSKPSSVLVGKKLKLAGVPLLQPHDLVGPQLSIDNKLIRIYALRNHKKWNLANSAELREEYARTRNIKSAKF